MSSIVEKFNLFPLNACFVRCYCRLWSIAQILLCLLLFCVLYMTFIRSWSCNNLSCCKNIQCITICFVSQVINFFQYVWCMIPIIVITVMCGLPVHRNLQLKLEAFSLICVVTFTLFLWSFIMLLNVFDRN